MVTMWSEGGCYYLGRLVVFGLVVVGRLPVAQSGAVPVYRKKKKWPQSIHGKADTTLGLSGSLHITSEHKKKMKENVNRTAPEHHV